MLMRGVARREPFFQTRTTPLFSATKMRPSGAKAKDVGRLRPDTAVCTVNPAGGADATFAAFFAARPAGWNTSPSTTVITATRPCGILPINPLPQIGLRIRIVRSARKCAVSEPRHEPEGIVADR